VVGHALTPPRKSCGFFGPPSRGGWNVVRIGYAAVMNERASAKPSRTDRRSQLKIGTAKRLRIDATESERKLWSILRSKQFGGLRFRRQQPLGPYIVDFYCSAAKLIIELDGNQHGIDENIAYDAARDGWLRSQGYRVLRFSNEEFLKHRDVVVEGIGRAVVESGVPLPEPPSAVRPSLKGRVG
jgi:very-short-patch-repair endonuclease